MNADKTLKAFYPRSSALSVVHSISFAAGWAAAVELCRRALSA
jgi:hypothetical protein